MSAFMWIEHEIGQTFNFVYPTEFLCVRMQTTDVRKKYYQEKKRENSRKRVARRLSTSQSTSPMVVVQLVLLCDSLQRC